MGRALRVARHRTPGTRAGDEPPTFSASDNVGIRRAEIVDVTDAANPRVVATEDYASIQTAQKTGCAFTRPRPCPDLKSETIAASPAIAGKRTLLLRVSGDRSMCSRARAPGHRLEIGRGRQGRPQGRAREPPSRSTGPAPTLARRGLVLWADAT